MARFDVDDLRDKVKSMYRAVAEDPHGDFHFEMGRQLASRLGYSDADLDAIPAEAIESFAASDALLPRQASPKGSGWLTSGAARAWTPSPRAFMRVRLGMSSAST